MPGSLTGRHSDTRLPRQPYDRRPLIQQRPLWYREAGRPPGQTMLPLFSGYIRKTDTQLQTVSQTTTSVGGLRIEVPAASVATTRPFACGSDLPLDLFWVQVDGKAGMTAAQVFNFTPTTVPLEITDAAAQTADSMQIRNSALLKRFWHDSVGRTYFSSNALSYLGASGEIWNGASVFVAGTFYYSAVYGASSGTLSGNDNSVTLIGDTTVPESAHSIKMYRSLLGHAIFDNWYVYFGGKDGRIHQKLQQGNTIGHQMTAHSSQTAAMLRIESNGAARWLEVDQTGKVQLTNGTSINEFSIDGTLAGNSDDAVPTEKAVKTYVDALSLGIPESTIDAKGDLLIGQSDNNVTRLAVGSTDHQILEKWDSADDDLRWADPGIPFTLWFRDREATAAGSTHVGIGNMSEDSQDLYVHVPVGYQLVILHASATWKSGTVGSTDYEFQVVVTTDDDTPTDVGSAFTTSTNNDERCESKVGTLASPLATISADTCIRVGWENSTAVQAIGNFTHSVHIAGYLFPTT